MKKKVLLSLLITLILIVGGLSIFILYNQNNLKVGSTEYSGESFQLYLNEAVTLKSLYELADKEEEIGGVCLGADLEEERVGCELPYKIQILSEEPNLCNALDSQLRGDDCYYFLAYTEKKLDLCSEIKEDLKKQKCIYDIKRKLGYEYTELSECEELPRGRDKQPCYRQVSSQLGSINECEEFPEDWIYTCYYEFASRTNNVSICDQYFEELTKERINEEEAKITAEAKAEGKFRSNFDPSVYLEDKYSNCYNEVAWNTDNVSLCKSNSCIHIIGKHTLDPKICNNIQSAEENEACFQDVIGFIVNSGGTMNSSWYPKTEINMSLY